MGEAHSPERVPLTVLGVPPLDADGASLEQDRLAPMVLCETTLPAGPPTTGSVPDAWLDVRDTEPLERSLPPLPAEVDESVAVDQRAQRREQDHVPNARHVGQEHDQAVDADAETGGRG